MQDAINFVQLTETIGTSGQPTETQFAAIAAAGYTGVINLAMPDSDNAIANEGAVVTGLGMSYIHIPVPFESPSVDHLRQFFGAMAIFEGRKVWVHCAVNARVSAFLYHYLSKVKQLPEAQCRSSVLDRWQPSMDQVWKDFISMPAQQVLA